jgi:hypothetical protein
VAAAAVNFIDWYKHTNSDLIDSPGVLFTNMLLMGDRQGQSGSYLTSKFDERWGAGRLQLRKFDSSGLDRPDGWDTGYTCIDDEETAVFSINRGSAISSSVDVFNGVIYWYDPRHEDGRSVSDIDMRLKTSSGTTLRSSLDSYDNKELVFSTNVGGQSLEVELNGYDVKTDSTICGRNSMLVYYAWFYEDSARNDADGPGAEIETEN